MSSIYPESGADGGPSPLSERDAAGGPVAEAREKLGEGAAAVRGEAAYFAERTRDEVAGQIEAKTEAVTDALGVFADAIRRASDELSGQDQTYAAKLATQAADGLQSLTRNLAGKSPEDMLHAARDLGRNNPTAFFAGAVLAGVAIGRFARSSAEHDVKSRNVPEPEPGLDAGGPLSGGDIGLTPPGAAFGREV
jgi:hypothetical protein